jgi:hypothetical protein
MRLNAHALDPTTKIILISAWSCVSAAPLLSDLVHTPALVIGLTHLGIDRRVWGVLMLISAATLLVAALRPIRILRTAGCLLNGLFFVFIGMQSITSSLYKDPESSFIPGGGVYFLICGVACWYASLYWAARGDMQK